MKVFKKQIIEGILAIILLSFACIYIYNKFEDRKDNNVTKIVSNNSNNCKNGLSKYYTDSDENNYYLYCLDELDVDFGNRTLELNKALDLKQVDMEFVLGEVKEAETFKDGGSTLYKNDDFAVLQCNTIDGNHDYYFGPSDMKYEEGFCKSDAYLCSFTKTYLLLDVSPSNDSNFVYLTLKEFQDEDVVTKKVNSNILNDLEEDHYYEFRFGSFGNNTSNNISDVFDNNVLLNVKQTNLIGSEQINEDVCK